MEPKTNQRNEKIYNEPKALLPFVKRLMGYFTKYRKWLWILFITIIINGATEALLPLVWKYLIDGTVTPEMLSGGAEIKTFNIPQVVFVKFIVIYLTLLISNAVSERIMLLFIGRLRHYVIRDLRSQMFSKIAS